MALLDVLEQAGVDGLPAQELALFVENGYEETTVAQIADRAGLNRATFFRHFADKREVLFGGEDVLAGLFAGGIRGASPDATLIECLQAAFAAAGVAMTPQQRAKAAQRWMKPGNDEPFPFHAAAALSDLQVGAAELDPSPRSPVAALMTRWAAACSWRNELISACSASSFAFTSSVMLAGSPSKFTLWPRSGCPETAAVCSRRGLWRQIQLGLRRSRGPARPAPRRIRA